MKEVEDTAANTCTDVWMPVLLINELHVNNKS